MKDNRKKIPLNAMFCEIGGKLSLAVGIYLFALLIFALISKTLVIFPIPTAEGYFLSFSLDKNPEMFRKNCFTLGVVIILLFVDFIFFRIEKRNTIKFDVEGVPRTKPPYNETWRLKILLVFLIITLALFLFSL